MQRSSFPARGVLVLALILALNAPIYALPSRDIGGKEKNPIVRIIKKIWKMIGSGDGIINPWPVAPPPNP